MTRDEALRLRAIMEQAVVSLDDKTASEAATFFPRLKQNNGLISAGTRINWNGIIKRAAVDLWDNAESTPDVAPTLWEDISYREGYRIIPETITSGLSFAKDECGWWNNILYKSLLDNNVWTPSQYESGWEKL